ncbi:MAG: NTP transferase domain-containing protein [Porphyrobacter sp.]|nr:NTP transferase domain-containing protein [Porphyrobacter sp.]
MEGWAALILAAGAGRRFGPGGQGHKLLADLAGAPVIRRTAQAVLAGGFAEVLVATGADHAAIAAALEGLACRIVPARDWEEGMAASLRTGLAALGTQERGVFVFLGDMPLVPVALCPELAAAAETAGYAARPRVGGVPGHPAAFTRAALPDLAALTGDRGAAALLRGRTAGVAYRETEASGAVLDIDTPADLAAAERAWKTIATSATSESAISRGALPKP